MDAFFPVFAGLAVIGAVAAVVIWRRRAASRSAKTGRRQDERAQAEARLWDEVKRGRERLGLAANAQEAVKRDPKRAARTVRSMMKKPRSGGYDE